MKKQVPRDSRANFKPQPPIHGPALCVNTSSLRPALMSRNPVTMQWKKLLRDMNIPWGSRLLAPSPLPTLYCKSCDSGIEIKQFERGKARSIRERWTVNWHITYLTLQIHTMHIDRKVSDKEKRLKLSASNAWIKEIL